MLCLEVCYVHILDLSIEDHLDPSVKEAIQRIIEMDKANLRLLEKYYTKTTLSTTSNEDSIDPALVFHLAELAPIFSQSKSCLSESFVFLEALVNNEIWAYESKGVHYFCCTIVVL